MSYLQCSHQGFVRWGTRYPLGKEKWDTISKKWGPKSTILPKIFRSSLHSRLEKVKNSWYFLISLLTASLLKILCIIVTISNCISGYLDAYTCTHCSEKFGVPKINYDLFWGTYGVNANSELQSWHFKGRFLSISAKLLYMIL